MNVLEEVRDGELVFRDGQLVELRTDGGLFSMWNDSLSTTQVRPYFYVTDYLGSVRMVCDGMTGAVRQSLEYLPSGEIFRADNYPEQSYMFCGKELMTMHGWNMYDSNARFQHSTQPRFSSLDPLAEKYYSLSPYNYAGNDPVNAADPSGLEVYDPDNLLFDYERELDRMLSWVEKWGGNGDIPDIVYRNMRAFFIKEKNKIRRLRTSKQMYSFHIMHNLSGGETIYDINAHIVRVYLGEASYGLFAHELHHAYQFETGELSFNYNGAPGILYDITDETDAYNVQHRIEFGRSYYETPTQISDNGFPYKFSDSDTYLWGAKMNEPAYQGLPSGDINLKSPEGRALRASIITNGTITNYYIGWEKDLRKYRKRK